MAFLTIYTDGSCLGNGRKDAIAGIGVYILGYPQFNLSEPLLTEKRTNIRAELYAIIRAIEIVNENKESFIGIDKVMIKTDSEFSHNCMEHWIDKWKNNNWTKDDNTKINNIDLLQKLDELMINSSLPIYSKYVRGHQKEPEDKNSIKWYDWFGNKQSDTLATNASYSQKK